MSKSLNQAILLHKRSIVKCILLNIVTLGFYSIYWRYLLIKNLKTIKQDNTGCTREMLLSLFVPCYAYYWWITRGNAMKGDFAALGFTAKGNGWIFFFLSFLGLECVSMSILQHNFNKLPFAAVHREPLVHITKRDQIAWWKAWLIRAGAILGALITAGVVIMLLTGMNPLDVYTEMFKGNFSNMRLFWMLMRKTSILLCVALGVTLAFKMKFWNCGGEGQILAGGMAAAACMIYLGDSVPSWVVIVCSLMASLMAGALWGVIPAFFKAQYNTNETLFTLMMNYVAINLVKMLQVLWESPKNSGNVGTINMDTRAGWLPKLFGQQYLITILIVAALCVLVYIYLKNSKHGYEITVVGESQNTARYIGINVKKVIIRTMLVSGAVCGLAGFLLVNGSSSPTIGPNTAGGQGFTAMMVAWMAKFNPFTMILTSGLIIFLQQGAVAIAKELGLHDSLADIVTGIILFFIIGCEFFIQYQVRLRHKKGGDDE